MFTQTVPKLFLISILAILLECVHSDGGFLKHDPNRLAVHLQQKDAQFRQAMEAVLGCHASGKAGGPTAGHSQLSEVRRILEPMWQVLPKNDLDRVEWKLLRYVAHRYFLQRSHLLIRGLEPVRQVNESHLGVADILTKTAPSLVESVLESKARASNDRAGFTLDDAVSLVATMEQVIYDSEGQLLHVVYGRSRKDPKLPLQRNRFKELIVSYMVHWLMGDDQEIVDVLLSNETLLSEEVPHWNAIRDMISGLVENMAHARYGASKPGHGKVVMENMFDFDDAHEIAATITKTFGSYWESECQLIKNSLQAMDTTNTGRVRLSDFYGANSDGEWRFGESEAYLRDLGALDESSPSRGKQVIIPNYIQGASNCIVTTQHYFVCCSNECESVLNDIEDAVKAPMASPEEILKPISRITVTLEDDAPSLSTALKAQLQRIADTHGGLVPLHGRLFAQWLHYVFPRDCPFPHKAGALALARSPAEYGESFVASEAEVASFANARQRDNDLQLSLQSKEQEEAQWLSQWSEEEELLSDLQMSAPWDAKGSLRMVSFIAAAIVALGSLAASIKGRDLAKCGGFGYDQAVGKAHFV